MARPKTLRPTRPSAGLSAEYRKHLFRLIERMHDSYGHWLKQAYPINRDNTLASDAPIDDLDRTLRALARYWLKRFADMASPLAGYFSRAVNKRTAAQLKKILKDGGFTVQFQMTPAMADIIDESIKENVALIKSIPKKYHREVREHVKTSVTAGHDFQTLTNTLQKNYGLTRDRASLIAKDQTSKVSAAMQRARQLEVNIKKAVWYHSHAGKQPRPTHVKNHLKTYDIAKGWYDPAIKKRIWPGTEINCRCFSKPVVPGLG